MDNYIKGLFAAPETSGDITGDYLQLEKSTYRDLQSRGLVPKDMNFNKIKRYPQLYDQVADIYIKDIMKTHKIPTIEEASLWSWRPAWYGKYQGDPTKIPNNIKGVRGKSAKEVMLQRADAVHQFLLKNNSGVQQNAQ